MLGFGGGDSDTNSVTTQEVVMEKITPLPPYGCLSDARKAAKYALEIDQLSNRISDPVKASMMKSCADALWQSSVDTYSFVFRQRGFT